MVKQISVSRGRRLFIVVIHLHPLPGSPRWGEDMERVSRFALDDARACEQGGADAIIIENFGDVPFGKGAVAPETVASMALIGVSNPVDSNHVAALRKAIQ